MFRIKSIDIENSNFGFIYDSIEQSGILKVLELVQEDLEKVFGCWPEADIILNARKKVAVGCIETAPVITAMAENAGVVIDKLRNKREVYLMQQVISDDGEETLYILGSDKRGTIYGLFHLSELCGVSPLVNWGDVMPLRREECVIEDCEMHMSVEPSVKYRGFFINDEWPAFGNWTTKNFGGFGVKMYAKVFELLLRMKGNYLWPAMWSAIFPNDGPGLENAKLADELGVVMGMSHHEPCLRQGEEYKYLRGKDSIYGDAWNFRTNREGITRFWEDGLKRSGKFENVITVGMRGEADSTILPKDSTLADNISLLKDVLRVQADLIRENVNEDLDQVPRMLALYKEVEPFYYGDENTEGLMDDPILDGITLMLCDDNHGNLRTVPTEKMRQHRGGFGMYYHLDYHGCPVSYEWVNSTALSKIWDQMTNAYELGIRELWIVNVGDIFTNEFPLSYFLNLAYDYERWGIRHEAGAAGVGTAKTAGVAGAAGTGTVMTSQCTAPVLNSAEIYTQLFTRQLFEGRLSEKKRQQTCDLLTAYTRIANNRRPEAMNDEVYAAFAYGEREKLQAECETLMTMASEIYEEAEGENAFSFYEFVFYPLMANLNLQMMWLDTTYNHALAQMGAAMANKVAERVKERLAYDRELTAQLHSMHGGKWYGMGLSEHMGFHRWCEEESRFPITYTFEPANKPRIIALVPETGQHTEGGFWSGITLTLPDFERYDTDTAYLDLYAASRVDAPYTVEDVDPALKVLPEEGVVPGDGMLSLMITLADGSGAVGQNAGHGVKDGRGENERKKYTFRIHSEFMDTIVEVPIARQPSDYISIEAEHFDRKKDAGGGAFAVIPGFGKTLSGVKAMPVTTVFDAGPSSPALEYDLFEEEEGDYTVRVYTAPGNPPFRDKRFVFGVQANEEPVAKIQTVPEDFAVTDHNAAWEKGVLDQIRINECAVKLRRGWNTIRLYAGTPGCTFEKIVIYKQNNVPQSSYLGPAETRRKVRE